MHIPDEPFGLTVIYDWVTFCICTIGDVNNIYRSDIATTCTCQPVTSLRGPKRVCRLGRAPRKHDLLGLGTITHATHSNMTNMWLVTKLSQPALPKLARLVPILIDESQSIEMSWFFIFTCNLLLSISSSFPIALRLHSYYRLSTSDSGVDLHFLELDTF